MFFKLLKLIPIVQEINRKHSEALNTIKVASNSSASQQQQTPSFSANNSFKQKCATNYKI